MFLKILTFGIVLFYYFDTEMLCAGCGSRQFQLRTMLLNKICKTYDFYAVLLILRTLANSVQNFARA